MQKTKQQLFTTQLLKQQMLLSGKVAGAANGDILREATFVPGTIDSALDRFVRVRGRPNSEWAKMLLKESIEMTGSASATLKMVFNLLFGKHEWFNTLRNLIDLVTFFRP